MAGLAIPDRVAWAVDRLDLRPDARVLEIGSGPGAAAELVCRRLTHGSLLGIDRSTLAVERAARRNQACIDAGRLELRCCALADLAVPENSFDLAFSVNVNLFWTGPAQAELDLLHRALRPGGRLHVLYGPAPGDPTEALATVRRRLEASRFGRVEVHRAERGSEVRATRAA
ncbi:MAG TPA: class I SAM-dependent methyltransferase [Propionibacteriaceae bacterium]|nr:class I SAM-dependent methyltransferase [Propionibacteriaceae bacterium]